MGKPLPNRAGYQRAAAGMLSCLLVGGSLGLKMQQRASSAPEDAVPLVPTQLPAFSGAEEADYLALQRQVYRRGENAIQRQPSIVTYTVQPGDSFWEIAYALDTEVAVLERLNEGVSATRLQPGQTLRVSSEPLGGESRRRGSQMMASRNTEETDRYQREETSTPEASPPAEAQAPPPSAGDWAWPVMGFVITSEFGPRWGTLHEGIDLAVPEGTVATAARGGTVEFSGWDGGYGYCVVIDHGDGTKTKYAHASALLVSAGDVVAQGTPILHVGSTGHSTGPHLHFEIIVNGQPQNPRQFFHE